MRGDLAGGLPERRPAGVLLPAAAVAAGAQPAVGDDAHVPPLPRDAVRTALQPAVEDDAAADAGAQRDHQRQVGAARRAVAVLGPGRGVGVVAHPQRPLQPGGEVLAQRRVPPGQVRAEQHGVAGAVEPAGRADAHADQLAVVPRGQLLDDGDDGVLGVADRRPGRGPPGGGQDRAVGRDDAAGDLRAADVDAERGQRGRVGHASRDARSAGPPAPGRARPAAGLAVRVRGAGLGAAGSPAKVRSAVAVVASDVGQRGGHLGPLAAHHRRGLAQRAPAAVAPCAVRRPRPARCVAGRRRGTCSSEPAGLRRPSRHRWS